MPLNEYSDYVSGLSKNIDEYHSILKMLDLNTEFKETLNNEIADILELGNGLLASVKKYLDGKPNAAYDIFADVMNFLWKKIEVFKRSANQDINTNCLYRIRKINEIELIQAIDMFHIPFNERHKVTNQRYSINGFPCLYLGSSVLSCWIELGANANNRYAVSKFKIAENVEIFDLFINGNKEFDQSVESDNYWGNWVRETIMREIYLYQLLLACSFPSIDDHPFRENYIVPQMLLEWIRSSSTIKGIKYKSTKMLNKVRNSNLAMNYVFPPNESKGYGHCDYLKSLFGVSDPVTLTIRKNDNYNRKIVDIEKMLNEKKLFTIR
ncbi:hypothetical protein [Marispirochaeta sp.]|uniref:hypothetical protein n=1 Tax=Marispirochaeta sp. TaxID=2038653 RepID=UPI0029C922DD|nr:hypothetical protein [Marispirochaeta sp.]